MKGLGEKINYNKVDCFRGKCSEEVFAMTRVVTVIPTATSRDKQGKESSFFLNKVDCFSGGRCEEKIAMTHSPFANSHFRYYASAMGRFMKPDNMITNAINPQSWNLYSYVNNNPVNFNDPSGHGPNIGCYPAYMQNTHSFGMTWFDQFNSSWLPWSGQTEENSWYFGTTRSALGYYASQYLNSQSIGGTLNAGHETFNDWISDLKVKGFNFDIEMLYYLKSIYKMSKDYGVELAFYISPTLSNGLAIIVIFGSAEEVNLGLSGGPEGDMVFFQKTLGFDWNNFFFYGHTHPQEGGKYLLGASGMDIDVYCKIDLQYPWTMGLIEQRSTEGNLNIMYVGFLPEGPFRELWIAP